MKHLPPGPLLSIGSAAGRCTPQGGLRIAGGWLQDHPGEAVTICHQKS